MITAGLLMHLKLSLPEGKAEVAAMKLEAAAEKHGINTIQRKAAFVAQVCHESGFVPQEENLNYSAGRLMQVWPARFPSLTAATPYANNPEALGNKVYGGRMGNGPERSGDGFRFRGRGFIQLTGRSNYTKYGQKTGFDLVGNPDLLLQYGVSSEVAAAFFADHNCNQLADRGQIDLISQAINGGEVGLRERRTLYQKALKYLSQDQ